VLNGTLPTMNLYEGNYYSWDVSDEFHDDEGDAITYHFTVNSHTFVGMNGDNATGIFSGTPTVADIFNGSYYHIHWYPRDIHYPTTGGTYYGQYVYVYPNRAPHNVSSIANEQFDAGYALSFTFADGLFDDVDGDTIDGYSFTSSPVATSWLSLDSDTRTFSGTPIINDDAVNHIITLHGEDNNTNSGHGNTVFYLNIIPNEIPEYDAGLYTAVVNQIVYAEFSYVVPADAFKDYEGDSYSIRHELIPNYFTTTYDVSTRTVNGTQDDNTEYGTYTIRFYVEDSWNVSAFQADLPFAYYQNMPPVVDTAPIGPACIIAHYPLDYSIPKSYFSEPEGETILYSFSSAAATAMSDWIVMTENATHAIFSGTPNNTQFGNQIISLILDDGHDDVVDTMPTFVI
jgi:hypothetical protein